jgi:hypothetical protein
VDAGERACDELIELFRLLQQRMAVQDEVWALGLRPLD